LEDIVLDEKILHGLQPIVACATPLAFVTCPSSTPTVFSITSQPANITICIQQNHTVASQRFSFAQRAFGSDRTVAIRNLVTEDTHPDGTHLLYITYSDIVCAPKKARKLFNEATHIVLDDVHEQSVDQELACWLLHQEQRAGLRATIVMTTPYESSGAFDANCLFLKGTESGGVVEPYRVHLSTKLRPLEHQYLGDDTGDSLDAAGYCDWVLGKMKALVRQLKEDATHKNGAIIVFVPSDRMMWDLDEDLRYPGVDVVILDPRDVVGLDQANGRESPAIILMRPYFGARPHIKNVCHVLCPAFDEQAILHCQAGKEIPTVNRLALDRIQFMADHARSSATPTAHYAFTETTRAEAPPTRGALFIKGNCLEYYLKALHVATDELRRGLTEFNMVMGFNMMGLRLNAYHERVQWAIRQLHFCDFFRVHDDGQTLQLRVTGMGVNAVKWMHYTGLSVHACGFLVTLKR
jgi:hypothetical protein